MVILYFVSMYVGFVHVCGFPQGAVACINTHKHLAQMTSFDRAANEIMKGEG